MNERAERILGYAWAASKVVLVVAFVLLIIAGTAIPSAIRKESCERSGGHFVAPLFGHDECWTRDGRRMFPEGF